MTGQDDDAALEPAVEPSPTSRRGRLDQGDGLAALTGSGASIVGVEGALRARDVSRPTAAHLATAATLPVRRATPRPGED